MSSGTISCSVLFMLVIMMLNLHRKFPHAIIIVAVVFAVATNGFVAFSKLKIKSRQHTEYRNTIIEMGKVTAPGYVVVGGWTNCILLEHYLSQKSYTPYYWIDTQDLSATSGELRQAEAFKKLREAVAARRQIWLSRDHAVFFSALKSLNLSKHFF